MKKVLIITYYWPPSGGAGVQRWLKFAKYLPEYGWEPIIYTIDNEDNYLSEDKTIANEVAGISVIRGKAWEPIKAYERFIGKKNKEKVTLNFLSEGRKLSFKQKIAMFIRGNFFIPDAKILWLRNSKKILHRFLQENKIDAVVSTGPPQTCHLIGNYVHQQFNIPWIVDFRDPWTQIDFFDSLKLTPIARWLHKRMEKKVLDNANLILSVGKSMKDDFQLLTNNQIEYLPNGFDEADIDKSVTANFPQKYTIAYIGTMNVARNPHIFWRALAQIKSENPDVYASIQVKFIGNIDFEVKEAIAANGIASVIAHTEYLPHKEALEITVSAHALLLVINHTHNAKTILTGKLFEYLASERPILCIGPKDGDAAAIINELNAGVVIDYNEVDIMKKTILDFYYHRRNSNQNYALLQKYSRKQLTKELAIHLNNITK